MRDPRYDILFEPVRIGPVTTKNRFFQVPHCNGMGHAMPLAHAAMREVKAEGGWGVISTEECEIHPSSDLTPYVEARLWDDRDIPALALMCDKVHAHGALAALELSHNGPTASNLYSREVLLAPSHQPSKYGYPAQARAMDLHDIAEYRRWHREAAVRGMKAGMDIIYVYAAHDLSLPMHFLQRRRNQRNELAGIHVPGTECDGPDQDRGAGYRRFRPHPPAVSVAPARGGADAKLFLAAHGGQDNGLCGLTRAR